MKKFKLLKWLLPFVFILIFFNTNAQINTGEYFFDTDPGIGNGIQLPSANVSVGTTNDSTTLTTSIVIPSGMNPGYHTLNIRYSKVINGITHWSNYEVRKFIVNPVNGNNISQAEYFFDTDPGFGNGTNIALNGNSDSSSFAGNIATTGLLPGYHTLHVRAKHVNGYWSNYETRKIKINVANGSSIVEAEYFYDTDPGIGNATSISLTGNTDSSSFAGNVTTTGLSLGIHQLCIRAKNANGQWSIYETKKVKILSNGNSIADAEYFFDTDPGVGNGQSISLVSTGDSATFNGNISTVGLTNGHHLLYVRAKNIEGQWSLFEQRKIIINSYPTTAEYFVDTDPGVGNGTSFLLNSLGSDSADFVGNIMTDSSLGYGTHNLYIRSKDNLGNWGNYESVLFYVTPTILNLNVFLQGYYNATTSEMSTPLYTTAIGQGSLSGNECDTITVELHYPTSTGLVPLVAYSYKGILLKNGTISAYYPKQASGENYYIVIKHKNSLETWSANPVSFSDTNSYNFTTSASQAFGNNLIEVSPGEWAIYSGDINQDGSVDGLDYPFWENDYTASAFGYYNTDLNGDGSVDGLDYPLWENNYTNSVYFAAP